MTNEDIQVLAEELSKLDREKDSERIRDIEGAICAHELGLLKNSGGKADFPLLGRKYNCRLPFDAFYDIFTNELLKLLKNYNPESAKFLHALMFYVTNRCKDYYTAQNKKSANEGSYEERLETLGDKGELPDKNSDFAKTYESPKSEFEVFCRVAPLVALRKAQEQHLAKSKRAYFEGFFTFDTTAQTKKCLFDRDDVVAENETLFPIMETIVLEYLLVGVFAHMRDVADNAVRDAQRLDRRNETMQDCYNLSKPTVVDRNKRYRRLWDAVNA
jgi:hypothetical protein